MTSKRAILLATFAGLAAVCLAAALHAEPEPTKETPAAPVTPTKAEPEPTFLAGPKVADKTEKLTLVQLDSEGKLVRIEDRPEVVAVPLLKLDGEAKKAVEKVLNEHGALVARALNENQALFLQIQSARQSGDLKAAMPLIRELRQKDPQLWEPPLLDQLAKAMPVEKAATLRSIVNEYLAAMAREPGPDGRMPPKRGNTGGAGGGAMGEGGGGGMMMQGGGEGEGMMQGGGGAGGGPTGQPTATDSIDPQTLRRIEANLVIREMARSLKTLTEMRREQVDHLLSGLGLTPEQDAQVRTLIRNTASKAKNGEQSPNERRALIEEIKKLLTVEQQKTLAENLKKR